MHPARPSDRMLQINMQEGFYDVVGIAPKEIDIFTVLTAGPCTGLLASPYGMVIFLLLVPCMSPTCFPVLSGVTAR